MIFYHTTTEFYIDSIKNNGLGSINPNINFNLLPFLKEMNEIAKEHLAQNEHYLMLNFTTKKIINQNEDKNSILNQTKTQFYPSIELALNHSKHKYGSQVLSRCVQFYELLKENNLQNLINSSIVPFSIEDLILKKPENIILELNDIQPKSLKISNVSNNVEFIRELNEMKIIDEKLFNMLTAQHTFELVETYPFTKIKSLKPDNYKGLKN